MALEQQTPSSSQSGVKSGAYDEVRASNFVGGSADPQTGAVIPATRTSSDFAPPPATPTTKLAKTPSLGRSLAGAGAGFATTAIGENLGAQIGGGLPLSEAAKNTFGNLGDVIAGPIKGTTAADTAAIGTATENATGAELGSTVGGTLGAGVGSLAGDLITGQKIGGKALVRAGASAVGFAVGNTILPGIGGFVGSFFGGLFCHAAGTLIRMSDFTLKPIEELKIGDEVLLGGRVLGRGEALERDLYEYKGTTVNGYHAVFEMGWFRRVETSQFARPKVGEELVYPIVTESHLLVCERYICADFVETDDRDASAAEKIRALNADEARRDKLMQLEGHLINNGYLALAA